MFKIYSNRISVLAGWAYPGLEEKDRLFGVGAIDLAGCGVVHMVGGIYGFIGTFFLG